MKTEVFRLSPKNAQSYRSDNKYVYYTVTKASYNNVLNSIKKSIDVNIAKVKKLQPRLKRITYNNDYTEIKFYFNGFIAGSDIEFLNLIQQFRPTEMDMLYYQYFSGKSLESLRLTSKVYDYNKNRFLFNLSFVIE